MPWIAQVPVAEATGTLKDEFDAAMARAGRVWHIVHVMSQNPLVMRHHTGLYKAIMHGPSPLSRRQREMVAIVVSQTIGCHY